MIPRGIGLWLPSALLLSGVPGCFPLRGPSSVTGTVGESLSVTCQYEERFKMNKKHWCRRSHVLLCEDIVMTRGSEEARNGRVTIRDHPDNLTFTVTLQSLTLEDAGTYMCGVGTPFPYHRFWNKESFRVEVSVIPGSSLWSSTTVPETIRSSLVHTQPSVTTEDTIPAPSARPRSLLGSLYFCILVFLELPLFLCMLSAVLWVNRPQRCSG
ncbi:CD300C molecule 2 precursor [Rattus norvegicus]|uniref:Immune activating receptor CD300d2 n=1 Tax=Rattus norvegicus TaxID=10116 RepID=D1MF50_RAT|nr:CD300C molecule 2 precursor [Rattus norvegicus]ACZ26242.1 immune activating receptor CD300d2 [Rattus norvegicus]|eukprot:NP_001161756.1 CD300C molecule 2 precursor [Rattus norvegicus]